MLTVALILFRSDRVDAFEEIMPHFPGLRRRFSPPPGDKDVEISRNCKSNETKDTVHGREGEHDQQYKKY
jgi:hypothetical protein